MVFQSRKWRMVIRTVTLMLSSVLMLLFAAPASYALRADAPKPLTMADPIAAKERPLAENYVYTWAVPDFDHAVTTKQLGATYHWIPLKGFNNQLFVRAEGDKYTTDLANLQAGRPSNNVNFYGKLTSLGGQAGADEAIDELELQGITIDKSSKDETMVLLYGEEPRSYRPIVPVWALLALFWVVALVGLVRIVRGTRQTRRGQMAGARS